jgi:WD40-like Beta Propeller Repeat
MSAGWATGQLLAALVVVAGASTAAVGCAQTPSTPVDSAQSLESSSASKINTAGWSDSPFISRDGQRLYFMYSRWDFSPFIHSGGSVQPVVRGPDRPGLHKNGSPWDESDIYVSVKNADGSWGVPVNLGLNGPFGDASGMEIDGGNTFIWLRGDGATNNIVMARKNPDGSWGAVTDLGPGINAAGAIQDNPYISADGNAIWFVSNRPGGLGAKDLWFSFKSAGAWSSPVNVGAPFNSAGDEDQPWISPVSNDVYWNGPSGIMHCVSNGSTCTGAPDVVVIPGCDFAAEVSMPDDRQTMFFGCGTFATGRVKIMYSPRQANGSWGTAVPVD